MKTVRDGALYFFQPVAIDVWSPCYRENVKPGDIVTVKALPGCPPPGTMGMCHILGPDGRFGGLVLVNSLQKRKR